MREKREKKEEKDEGEEEEGRDINIVLRPMPLSHILKDRFVVLFWS